MATDNLLNKEEIPMETDHMLQGKDGTDAGKMVSIQRPALQVNKMYSNYKSGQTVPPSEKEGIKQMVARKFACSGECVKDKLLGFLPFISVMRGYQWRNWIVSDIIAGLSVGVIHIPQGMGFALLTQLPAVYGLYSSFWPVLFYFFFGTSRHISIGTMALISLMISAVISDQMAVAGLSDNPLAAGGNDTEATNGTDAAAGADDEIVRFKVGIAMSVTLLMGISQVIMSFLRLGVIATFMSMTFTQSFMTGAAVNIITSQVPTLFQIKLPPSGTMFKAPVTYIELFKNITETNIASLVTGLICIVILYVLKEIINDRYRSKLKVPIPAELAVVIVATIISHFCKFNAMWEMKIIGEIKRGLPTPVAPTMYNWQSYIVSSAIIGVVSFAISISMAKLMSRKHVYPIDTNQEMMAYGISYGLGAFFHSFGGAQAPPRTVVQDLTGGKTQLASLVSCLLVFLVFMALGPLFQSLPNTVLAAIIIVALIPLIKSFRELPTLWRINKYDFFTWVVTICCTVFFEITVGLVVGIGFNIFTVIVQALSAKGEVVAEVAKTGIYTPLNPALNQSGSTPGIKVFRFASSLYFVNCETFKTQLFQNSLNPTISGDEKKATKDADVEKQDDDGNNEEVQLNGDSKAAEANREDIRTIILDCSQISYIDMMGLNLLTQLQGDYKKANVAIVLAGCGTYMTNKLTAVGVIKADNTSSIGIYPTVHDAVVANQ